MKISTATLATEHGAKYMKQLCRHWGHKFTVTFDDTHGRIELPQAVCMMDALQSSLTVRLQVSPDGDQRRMEEVVAEHLQRFGFQETLVFDWEREPD